MIPSTAGVASGSPPSGASKQEGYVERKVSAHVFWRRSTRVRQPALFAASANPAKRKRRRADCKRWERSRSMELWQMDVVGRIHLVDGTELSAVTGLDGHSRFCVCAWLVARATARPMCDALVRAMPAHGAPEGILTDNGKVFTARFGKGPGPVLFDRICAENGIRHLLTAPYSPTTTGKVERFHKTLRAAWVSAHDYEFAAMAEAQASLDGWVDHYNNMRPHQSVGMVPPVERFKLAGATGQVSDVTTNWFHRQGCRLSGGFGQPVDLAEDPAEPENELGQDGQEAEDCPYPEHDAGHGEDSAGGVEGWISTNPNELM